MSRKDTFGSSLYDVEHALSMYAHGFSTLPAEAIYDEDSLKPMMSVIESCHIYLVGYTPKIDFTGAHQEGDALLLKMEFLGQQHDVRYRLPEELRLREEDGLFFLEDKAGQKSWPKEVEVQQRLADEVDGVNFNVKYIGQAFGKDGSRNAIDRLLKHETLQRISLKGVPEGHILSLLLLSIQPNNQIFTAMNPFAKEKDDGSERIRSGLDKLFNTNEKERIALYEAALIRYFSPEFNKEFKDSFPSTNLKILQDCYEKDFCSVVAEICIDELPFRLCSESVEPKMYHIAHHDLHKSDDRRMFFGV